MPLYFFSDSLMKKMFLLLAAVITTMSVLAEQIDQSLARKIAGDFLVNSHLSSRMKAPTGSELELKKTESSRVKNAGVAYYIFTTTDSYIIVAGDDRAEHILAYGDYPLDVNNIPPGLQDMLGQYKDEIEFLQKNPNLKVDPTVSLQNSKSLRTTSVGPLLTAKWSQEAPFNNKCVFSDYQCVTGPTATSAAMVFYYWKYPTDPAPALPGYSAELNYSAWASCTYNYPALPSITFDWNNMRDDYTSYTSNQANAVAWLMRYVGHAEHMSYGTSDGGSGLPVDSVSNICNPFLLCGYDPTTIRLVKKTDYSDAQWASMLQREMMALRPVVLSALSTDGGGHAFNVDGYDSSTNKYHVNYGWSGDGNGWFALNAFNYGDYTLNQNQQMIIGIQPPGYQPPFNTYAPVMLPADEEYLTSTSFRADWTDETPVDSVVSYTLEVSPKPAELEPIATLSGTYFNGSGYYYITLTSPWGGINTRGHNNEIVYFRNNWQNDGSYGNISYTIPEGYVNAAFTMKITTGTSTTEALGNLTVVTPSTPGVTHYFNPGETYNWVVTASSGEKITITTPDNSYSPDIAKIEVYVGDVSGASQNATETGDGNNRLITGITNMFYMVNDLEAEGSFLYRVKALYIDGTESDWSNTEEVTLLQIVSYAVYDSSTATLTFYHDDHSAAHTGATETVYSLNEDENAPGWHSDGSNASVTTVVFDESFASARPTSMNSWFAGMSNLTEIVDIANLDTRNVTTMRSLFYNCSSLTSIDVSHFKTQNVTNMRTMFYQCSNLTNLDVSNFNTQHVTNMYFMFGYCSGLTNLDLSSFDTQNVTNMSFMFSYCYSLTSLDLSSFNTANVTDMRCMFDECHSLTTLDLFGFDTQNVVDMDWMFNNCNSLTSIFVQEDWNTDNATTSKNMFYGCSSLAGAMGTVYDTNHLDKEYARIDNPPSSPGYLSGKVPYVVYDSGTTTLTFYYDDHSAAHTGATETVYSLNIGTTKPGWYTDNSKKNVTKVVIDPSFVDARPTSGYWLFAGLYRLTSFEGVENLNTSEMTTMNHMFDGIGLSSLDLSHFDTSKVTDMAAMFSAVSMTSLDLSSFDTKNVMTMNYMFGDCTELTEINLSSFNTRNVSDMQCMFTECSALTSLDLTGFNTESAYRMDQMFFDCCSLVSLDLSSFDTWGVTTMQSMFCDCSGLTELDLTGFNTKGVDSMEGMFSNCSSLSVLDLSSFDTNNVVDMGGMFANCSSLTKLNLSSFDTEHVCWMRNMFKDCSALTTIYVGDDWVMDELQYSTDMFKNCVSIVGGKGTTYDADHVDEAYARIDEGPDNPGYFTEKPETYAVFAEGTMTFYYDHLKGTRAGLVYKLNEGDYEVPVWYSDGINTNVIKVVFDASFDEVLPASTFKWFSGMSQLTYIEGMENLNTSEVTTMSDMFEGCFSLTSLDLSHFNTAKVTDMTRMFSDCGTQTMTLDVSHFDTQNVTNMQGMFAFYKQTELDLSGFDTRNVTNMSGMFALSSDLKAIYVGNSWTVESVTASDMMFAGCTSLVGGKNTVFDENHVDKEYAHIDGGENNPGYLSEKPVFKKGDVNLDGEVNVSDVTMLVSMILGNTPQNVTADVNEDTDVNVSDVTALVSIILGQ